MEIKQHNFFKGFDWEALYNKKVQAPFVPEISGNLDVHNFDEEFTGEEIQMTMISDSAMNLIKKNQNKFKEFDN